MTERMRERIPIIEVGGQLLISVQRELNDVDAVALQNDILSRLRESDARGVLLDVSGVDVVDSYIARVFNDIGSSTTSMGATTILVGLRPGVAMTLVEMGVELSRVRSALTLDLAMAMLRGDASVRSGHLHHRSIRERIADLTRGREDARLAQGSDDDNEGPG